LNFQEQAKAISLRVAEAFSVVGLFCIEFFVTSDGRLIINEMAPRPHNSGHLTIEAFDISQFEMQVRAICNLPLRQPQQISPAAMANLLGDVWSQGVPNWAAALECPQTYLHLYGKIDPRPGRKMGHLTVLDATQAVRLVQQARTSLVAK
jgi:5-(carboxyamino)imidazole ribonucleotide synthase